MLTRRGWGPHGSVRDPAVEHRHNRRASRSRARKPTDVVFRDSYDFSIGRAEENESILWIVGVRSAAHWTSSSRQNTRYVLSYAHTVR